MGAPAYNMGYMEDIISRNVAYLMSKQGLTQKELADAAGVSQPTIHKIVSGKTDNSRHLWKVAKALGCEVEDLYSDGLRTLDEIRNSKEAKIKESAGIYQPASEVFEVPVRNAEVSAGSGICVDHDRVVETVPVSLSRLSAMGVDPHAAQIVNVNGESMDPTLMHGDQVMVNLAATRLLDGKVYAFEFEGETRVKRFSRRLDGAWRIISDNTDKNQYPDEVLANHNLDCIRIIGQVVGLTFRQI
ncbi:XRE family transcriptional regulator [Marinobacterium stanieri]|uniref:XRE family transcriptional regulator n=1 Tax=Marinobacterium stanieri TaxID=49186 RepID=UPI000255782C|nr:S24 family peptidase [Marinobacterium stanieri]